MASFAEWIASAPARALRDLAMGRQIAECLGSPDLAEWCKQRAECDYDTANLDDMDMARYHLARMDIPALTERLAMPGHMGWHIAARLAEYAFHAPDIALLDKAIARLVDFSGVDTSIVDPQLEYVLADISYEYLRTKLIRATPACAQRCHKYQEERLQVALMRAKPQFRQRAVLDWARMYLGIHYGEAA